MTKQKSTKRALLLSALSLLMCVSMLIGSTFAWFTDSVTSGVNTIQAGTLKVDLENAAGDSVVGKSLSFVKAAGHESEAVLWEPGCTYELTPIYVHNEGTLALKYKVVINGLDGDAELLEAIDWKVKVNGTETDLATFEETLNAGAKSANAIVLVGHMDEEAGNEYQGLTADGISITVYATQATVENDSFNNQYDKDATYDNADNEQLISTVEELDAVLHNPLKYNKYYITNDIDMAGYAWTPATMSIANPVVDQDITIFGNGHKITNLNTTAADNAGLIGKSAANTWGDFIIKDLTIEDATVTSTAAANSTAGAGAFVGHGAVNLDNCSVVNSNISGAKYCGGAVGYDARGGNLRVWKDVTVIGTTVTAYNEGTDSASAGALIGYSQSTTSFDGVTVAGNTVDANCTTKYVGSLIGTPNKAGMPSIENAFVFTNLSADNTNYVGRYPENITIK